MAISDPKFGVYIIHIYIPPSDTVDCKLAWHTLGLLGHGRIQTPSIFAALSDDGKIYKATRNVMGRIADYLIRWMNWPGLSTYVWACFGSLT